MAGFCVPTAPWTSCLPRPGTKLGQQVSEHLSSLGWPREAEWAPSQAWVDGVGWGGGRTSPPTLCHGLSPPSTPKPWLGPHSWPPSLGWVVAALCPLRDHIRRVYIYLEQRQEILGKTLALPPGLGPLQNQKRPHFLHLSLGKHLLQRNPL